MSICGSKYRHTNGIEYICLEDPDHTETDGTMHEAETFMSGPVNW